VFIRGSRAETKSVKKFIAQKANPTLMPLAYCLPLKYFMLFMNFMVNILYLILPLWQKRKTSQS